MFLIYHLQRGKGAVVRLGTTAPCSSPICWHRQKKAAAEAEQQRRMEEAEQRRKALAEGAEDSELPGAERPPPAPKPVPCTAQLLPADLPGESGSPQSPPS